jgi:hypothetical protein
MNEFLAFVAFLSVVGLTLSFFAFCASAHFLPGLLAPAAVIMWLIFAELIKARQTRTMTDTFICANCGHRGELTRHGRCTTCDSDQVYAERGPQPIVAALDAGEDEPYV